MANSLFDPIKIGAIQCPNRIFMAPLTRMRGTQENVPTPMMGEYYSQRAAAGLVISEATGISREGLGMPCVPGLWHEDQTKAWQPVVDSVHQAGGRIIAQLWHMGRIVLSDYNDGKPPISSSATQAPGRAYSPTMERKPYEVARALEVSEVPRILDDYGIAAENAKKAGFDGIQLHAANGYFIDEFLRDGTNLRTDEYGGAIENRIRLLGEVVARLVKIWGKEYVSVRLSPNGDTQGCNDSNPQKLFPAAAALLDKIGIASLELREPPMDGTFGKAEHPPIAPTIRKEFSGPLILNSDYDLARAEATMAEGIADAISFGRTYLANPDLVERFRQRAALNPDNIKTWYTRGPAGYTDYPPMNESNESQAAAAAAAAIA